MAIDPAVRAHVEYIFKPLNGKAAAHAFPAMGALSDALGSRIPSNPTGIGNVNLTPDLASLFASASVDMWMRSVHSFLVSAGLTNVSHIWASVAGYYSSHYSVRALAHLLGYFQLHGKKKSVKLRLLSGRPVCEFQKKQKDDREHVAYWKLVKKEAMFASEALFAENAQSGTVPSDVSHRDKANYFDHLPQFPTFRPLDEPSLKGRIHRISEIEISVPPIPDVSKYPDVESVQIVAYHRLVWYRTLVDGILGGDNRFWSVYRNPAWASAFMDYQLTEQANLRIPFS